MIYIEHKKSCVGSSEKALFPLLTLRQRCFSCVKEITVLQGKLMVVSTLVLKIRKLSSGLNPYLHNFLNKSITRPPAVSV